MAGVSIEANTIVVLSLRLLFLFTPLHYFLSLGIFWQIMPHLRDHLQNQGRVLACLTHGPFLISSTGIKLGEYFELKK